MKNVEGAAICGFNCFLLQLIHLLISNPWKVVAVRHLADPLSVIVNTIDYAVIVLTVIFAVYPVCPVGGLNPSGFIDQIQLAVHFKYLEILLGPYQFALVI